ncbi:uncharacterized protein LOC120885357 [Ictidomys tridecemlineatus]
MELQLQERGKVAVVSATRSLQCRGRHAPEDDSRDKCSWHTAVGKVLLHLSQHKGIKITHSYAGDLAESTYQEPGTGLGAAIPQKKRRNPCLKALPRRPGRWTASRFQCCNTIRSYAPLGSSEACLDFQNT